MPDQADPTSGNYPAPNEAADLRKRLVAHLVNEGAIRSPLIERAFAQVPREFFLPPELPLQRVYSDDAIVVKWDEKRFPSSSSTQPLLMADMLEALQLEPGMRVLEIGAGVGYNAAIIAHILGDGALLTSVDLDPGMVENARSNLRRLAGLLGQSFERVHLVAADGSLGYAPNAPYDRIIVTVQQWEISPHWVEQLRVGGILLLPLTVSTQVWGGLIPAFRKDADEVLRAVGASHGGFMPMRGSLAHPLGHSLLDPARMLLLPDQPARALLNFMNLPPAANEIPRLVLSGLNLPPELVAFHDSGGQLEPDPDGVQPVLFGPMDNQRETAQAYYGFNLLLAVALQDDLFYSILQGVRVQPESAGQPGGSPEQVLDGWRYDFRGLAVLEPNGQGYDLATLTQADPAVLNFNKIVRSWRWLPSGGTIPAGSLTPNRATQKLNHILDAWQRMGRPTPTRFRPLAYPADQPAPQPGFSVPRRFYNILLPT